MGNIIIVLMLILLFAVYLYMTHKKEWIPIGYLSQDEIQISDIVFIADELCRITDIDIGEIQVRRCYPWETLQL